MSARWRTRVLHPSDMTDDELRGEATHLRDIYPSLLSPISRDAVKQRNRLLVTELRSREARAAYTDSAYAAGFKHGLEVRKPGAGG